ncbi:hypothetical protein QR680_015871 [Steinernema hermaphroditum]|uniref:alpha-1,2-Mannosidase n=1 Tax=Steinernema hermaphroditum TaxID=289476 RepID=A0AA39H988_9BILA|nr:hypothetical protein QR680_015871 [Steinernema hermaphroditum]
MQLLRDGEQELPYFVGGDQKPASFSIARRWRGLPRLQRTLFTFLAVGIFVFLVVAFGTTNGVSTTLHPKQLVHEKALEVKDGKIADNDIDFDVKPERDEQFAKANLAAEAKEQEAEGDAPDSDDGGAQVQVVEPRVPKFSGPTNDRQKAVVDAMKHSWKGYRDYAWGHDTLKPISKGYSEWFSTGLTIIDSLDTLFIMGMDDEFADAKDWVEQELSFDKDKYVSFFEATIRLLGGLLSAFHLSGERIFLDKARDVGGRLAGAMLSPSGIAFSDVNLKTGEGKQPAWGGESSLSEVTTVQLEFRDLARVTKNSTFEKLAFKISEHIHEIGCGDHGLCGMYISPATGKFKSGSTITFGARADSYYEYLLKQWLQTGKTVDWLLEDYKKAMDGMQSQLLKNSVPNNYSFVGELLGGTTFSPKMDHLVCFLSGTLALGTANGLPKEHMDIAKKLGLTCKKMYETATGLGPEIAHFNEDSSKTQDIYIKPLDAHSLLRPEAFEAWFYLYRLTGDKQYQEWGWEAFQAIEKYARVEHGYSSVQNVKRIPVSYKDMMESFFLAESLKYLYLLFADDQTMIPLNEYVFNTEGHPLPIYDH